MRRSAAGAPAVAEGRLLVMVGGDADVVERCRPVFASYADPIVHLGALGSGQTTKLLNNVLFTANLGTAATALALGEALGVSPDRLTEVISRGSGNSFALNVLGGDTGGLARLAGLAGTLLQKGRPPGRRRRRRPRAWPAGSCWTPPTPRCPSWNIHGESRIHRRRADGPTDGESTRRCRTPGTGARPIRREALGDRPSGAEAADDIAAVCAGAEP